MNLLICTISFIPAQVPGNVPTRGAVTATRLHCSKQVPASPRLKTEEGWHIERSVRNPVGEGADPLASVGNNVANVSGHLRK
jgi:hypothetical protein